ncbi:hypothetical protein [Nocardia sp. GAS34]|uniref:hypothetical protein n=1 Tax=unclassified Nocardia TaxID=2637762 RepID=UPI003D20678E
MLPLLPVGIGAFVLALLETRACGDPGVACTGDLARHIGATMEIAALFFTITQWPCAYWLPTPQRVVMACVPPVLTALGAVVVV